MRWMLIFALCLLNSCAYVAKGDQDLGAAIEAARQGNLEPLAKLEVTASNVPELATYLEDSSETVRAEMVALLGKIGGPNACEALARPLTDESEDIREHAARALHRKCSPGADIAPALRRSVAMGNTAAASLLMLGRSPGAENIEFLKPLLDSGKPMKLEPWYRPVRQGLVAAVAAASSGYAPARAQLHSAAGPLENAEFLASVLPDVHDSRAAREMLFLLDDERTTSLGVPSGAEPRRRICDLAVEGFARRLNLSPFPLRPGDRYSAGEIAEIKTLAERAIDNL